MRRLRDRGGPEGTRYTMREKMFSVGDDFWIETEGGERAFKVNGKALRVRETLVLESRSGEELFTIQEKKLSVRDKMEVERSGKTVATVKKALVGIRDRYSIEVEGGDDLSAKGNIVDHEYEIERDGDKVAEVSKRWFRVRDAYGIEVAPGQDDALILARGGLHRSDGPRLSPAPRRAAMTTTGPGQVRAFRRERLGRELRRRRGLRATGVQLVVSARGRRARTRRAGDTDRVHGLDRPGDRSAGGGRDRDRHVHRGRVLASVPRGPVRHHDVHPRLNLFRDAPIVWHAFGYFAGIMVFSFTAAFSIGAGDEQITGLVPITLAVMLWRRCRSSGGCRRRRSIRSSLPRRSGRSPIAGAKSSTISTRRRKGPPSPGEPPDSQPSNSAPGANP